MVKGALSIQMTPPLYFLMLHLNDVLYLVSGQFICLDHDKQVQYEARVASLEPTKETNPNSLLIGCLVATSSQTSRIPWCKEWIGAAALRLLLAESHEAGHGQEALDS